MSKRIEPVLGDYEAALANDTATESYIGDVPAGVTISYECVCFDSDGLPLNQCNECPR